MRHTLRGELFKEPRAGAALAGRPVGGEEDADLTLVPVDVIFFSETLDDRFSSLEIVDEEKVFFNFNFFASSVGRETGGVASRASDGSKWTGDGFRDATLSSSYHDRHSGITSRAQVWKGSSVKVMNASWRNTLERLPEESSETRG
jgi:hypothetical protein